MSSLYFGLDVFCQSKTRVPEFEAVFSVQCTVYPVQVGGGGGGCLLGLLPKMGRIQITQTTVKTSLC
jgi:hypothetical protein